MISWVDITLICVSTVVMVVLILIVIRKKCSKPTAPTDREGSFDEESPHQNHSFGGRKKPLFFSWSDHPCLAAEAVENGWPRFAFASTDGKECNVEMSWEVFDESVDYMQKIRVNSEIKESLCVVRAALPLPGPQFAHTSFPREAYFEIRILPNHHEIDNDLNNMECLNEGRNSDSKTEDVKLEGKDEMILVGIGLTGGTSFKIPGSFLGSVGFNSSGSVYLDGKKLVGESEKEEWGRAGNVIGCGYNPAQKKVFFTVNSQLAYEIRCKTEEFAHPLYPTLAANGDATVVVNLGQSPFTFEAANSRRTQNPCFIAKNGSCSGSASAPFYELDSRELFSMGGIDGKWKHSTNNAPRSTENIVADTDLFEIGAA